MVVLFAVMVAGCFKLHTILIEAPTEQVIRSEIEYKASLLAIIINQFVDTRQKQLGGLADRPLTSHTLTAGLSDRQQQETTLTELIKGADYTRLIAADDEDIDQHLNFVALDMTRRVLSGESVTPEAMKLENRWHILFAAPIDKQNSSESTAERIEGCLLASFPAGQLTRKLQQFSSENGRVRLIQSYAGARSQPFISLGSVDLSSPSATVDTRLPHWSIEFSPSAQLLQNLQPPEVERGLFYGALAVTALVMLWTLAHLIMKRRAFLLERQQREQRRKEKEQAALASATSFLSGIHSVVEDTEAADNSDIFDLPDEMTSPPGKPQSRDDSANKDIPESIFRAYDIRGIYGEGIDESLALDLGRALGTLALERDQQSIVTAHDGRISSPSLYKALLEGIESTGCDVIALGQGPTPLMNFAINYLNETSSGVAVTASHNPPEYNGFKMSINGIPLTSEEIRDLRTRIINRDFLSGEGTRRQLDLVDDYIERIAGDIVPAHDLHVIVDASNGVAGPIAPQLLEQLGCTVTALHCDVDGTFPNHPPDTSVAANLNDLIQIVRHKEADLGIAFDGDGDRVVAVTASGKIVWPDELMMIFARDVLTRQPGADIVFDVKSTRRLGSLIGSYGGRPIMWKTGHSYMREKIRELNAPLGGEYSGHLFFNDRWYGFDDGLYGAARLIEIISIREQSLDDMLATLPTSASSTEVKVAVPEHRKFELIDELIEKGDFKDGKLTTLDGLRVDFANSWGLVRASNTTPALTLRFEGDTKEDLVFVRKLIKAQLLAVEQTLAINF